MKCLNRLQSSLLKHDFIIQYKKGSNTPADYLSRLPSITYKIAAFDPFQVDLAHLQKQDPILKMPDNAFRTRLWPSDISQQDGKNYLLSIGRKNYQDKNKLVWLQLSKNSTLSTRKILKGGTLQSAQQHFRQIQHNSEDLPKVFVILLLAEIFS